MSKSILIIGGNGYIGSRLINDLHSLYHIHSIDLCWFSNPNFSTEVKDYRNLDKTELSKYDVVILLAGHSSVKMCDGPVISSWNNNVNNFINLVENLDKSQLLIYASSGSIYGSGNVSSNEDDPIKFKPINNYDLTKYALDIQALNFIKQGYNLVGLRFGTVNGWSPNTRDELMINSMTKKSLYEKEITINNKQITRPILGIADLSNAVKTIIQQPVPGIYNLASFTDTVSNISLGVSQLLHSTINESVNIAGVYDFDMNTSKFSNTYNFTFGSTVESIVNEIVNNIDDTNFSNRNIFINYDR